MKKIWKPLLLIVIIGIIAAELFFDYRSSLDTSSQLASTIDLPVGTNSGELAPDFSGTTLDGEIVQLSDLRGKTVLVNIFASWCGPCRAEAPHLVEVDNLLGEDVVLLGLNLQENISAVERYLTSVFARGILWKAARGTESCGESSTEALCYRCVSRCSWNSKGMGWTQGRVRQYAGSASAHIQ